MNPLTENEWDSVRSDYINGRLSENLRDRFAAMFAGSEEVIPIIHFDGLDQEQKNEAFAIYVLNGFGEEDFNGGRKHRKSKKYKRTRRRRSRKQRCGRKSRRHR